MIEHYVGLKQYKRDLVRKVRQGLVPGTVQVRYGPPNIISSLLGKTVATYVSVHYIPVQEKKNASTTTS